MPTRWCPTAEQVMILEEMYKGGLRTPNASQIQKITAHLSFYGIIEGKNVFYWFQNHKARDRQRLRRKFITKQILMQDHNYNFNASSIPPSSSSSCFDLHHKPSYHKSSAAQYLQQGDDDWMMMMALRETCDTSHCCNRPQLKTLQLFPIKEEEEQQCSTTSPENVPSSSMYN